MVRFLTSSTLAGSMQGCHASIGSQTKRDVHVQTKLIQIQLSSNAKFQFGFWTKPRTSNPRSSSESVPNPFGGSGCKEGAFLPGGLAGIRDLNNGLHNIVKLYKEFCTRRLQEYDVKGYLECCYCPTDDANLGHSSHPIGEGK
ncbi:hypothetical protein BS78_04G182600 [Paspalum vaginatum]|nr:hypothetical protein BS78_04G182600 [Paspalum vaginatum]